MPTVLKVLCNIYESTKIWSPNKAPYSLIAEKITIHKARRNVNMNKTIYKNKTLRIQ